MSKVPVISFLRLSVYVKIRHFGLNQACKENHIPEMEGSGRNIFITKFYALPLNCTRGSCRSYQFLKQAVPTEDGLV